jgi:hypothetical protein
VLDPMARVVRILQGVADQAYQDSLPSFAPSVIGRSQAHQLSTVSERGDHLRFYRGRQAPEQLTAASEEGCFDHLEAVESPVP